MFRLYRDFETQTQIDAQYGTQQWVVDPAAEARHYVERSRLARESLRCSLDVPFGPTLDETLDIFPAARPGAPVFVFVHGGYWRANTSKEFGCVALGLVPAGITTVIVNYSLCPKVTIDEITRQVRAAIVWVLKNIDRHGGDPARVALGGHSAGGHLTAMALQTAWREDYGLPEDPLAAAVLVSGIYDLAPLRYSYLQPLIQCFHRVGPSVRRELRSIDSAALVDAGSDGRRCVRTGGLRRLETHGLPAGDGPWHGACSRESQSRRFDELVDRAGNNSKDGDPQVARSAAKHRPPHRRQETARVERISLSAPWRRGRTMIHRISIDSTGESFACAENVHLLEAMEMARCHGIPVGCRNGGCGACKVQVTSGSYQTRKMNRAVLSAAEEAEGRVLACKTYPRSDLVVHVLGRVWQAARVTQSTSFSVGFAWTTSIPRPDKET